jgi:transaldolase
MHPILEALADQGQAIWYDNVRRGMLASGEMQALIDDGVVGVTSNPSIFEKAIAHSDDYDGQIGELIAQGKDTFEIYDALTLADIATTADLFRNPSRARKEAEIRAPPARERKSEPRL